MIDLNNYFQLSPIPTSTMTGSYNWYLVALSYLIAALASYVALDITERIRTSGETFISKFAWLSGGAFAMGMGIWTMHFIGMLAFVMPMPMDYDPILTALSLVLAVIASAFSFFLIKNEKVKPIPLMLGGVLLGLGIVSMHYTGMSAMMNVQIRYIPSLFLLSIVIAIFASEVALWLMIKSSQTDNKYHNPLKLVSALIMGLAICGMHYTGMAAAVFGESTPSQTKNISQSSISPNALSLYIAGTTIVIISIALAASRLWMNALQTRNKKLIETEKILEQKSSELQSLNQHLILMAEQSIAREQRIRAILKAAADGIIVIDDQGIIEICNRAAGEIFGTPEDEMISQNITSFVKQKENGVIINLPLSSLVRKKDMLLEFFGISNKKIIPIEVNISESLINNKNLYIIAFRDITERKKNEEKLNALNHQLISTARLAGMAEVATCVLHNVGNVLNSINVSAQILLERDTSTKAAALTQFVDLLQSHKKKLDVFIKTNPIGQILPEYIKEFADYWKYENNFIHKEIESLNTKVQHIKSIVAMQQTLSKSASMIEKVQINDLLDDALSINSESIEKNGITIERDYAKIPPFDADKVKILQALVNILKNGFEALIESHNGEKKLTIRTKIEDPGYVNIEISDNGIGIKAENLTSIFSYGFSTKEKGHGFGLHSSALTIQEAGGTLKAYSEGIDQGATFVLRMPLQIQTADTNN